MRRVDEESQGGNGKEHIDDGKLDTLGTPSPRAVIFVGTAERDDGSTVHRESDGWQADGAARRGPVGIAEYTTQAVG